MNAETAPSALPPLEPLLDVARRLDHAGIRWALGGSALLYALGLAEHVRDWDLTSDHPHDEIAAALRELEPVLHGNSGIHADHKLVCHGGVVEVIARFAFFGANGVIRIPTERTDTWRDLPLGSPEAWAVAYTLLIAEAPARAMKADALFHWLERHGDARRLRVLFEQPLPEALARRLERLARDRTPS